MGERGAGDLLKEGQPSSPVGGDRGAGFDFDAREVRIVSGEEIHLVSRMLPDMSITRGGEAPSEP